jgi:tmRNA-binding protein
MFNKNDLELYSKFNEIDKKCHNICFEYCNPSNTYVSFPKDVKFNVEKDIVYINYKIESSYMVDFRTIKILVDDFINLSEKEIKQLQSYRNQKYMIVPIAIFPKGKWLKLELGVGRKLRKYEKREKIKARDLSREVK